MRVSNTYQNEQNCAKRWEIVQHNVALDFEAGNQGVDDSTQNYHQDQYVENYHLPLLCSVIEEKMLVEDVGAKAERSKENRQRDRVSDHSAHIYLFI